jgi:arginase
LRPIQNFEWLTRTLSPDQLIYIAIRDVDDAERLILKDKGIRFFGYQYIVNKRMDEIIEDGIGTVMKKTIDIFKDKPIHISFDVDAIDPAFAHGTGTLVDGGLSYREAHYILRKLCSTGQTVGLDLVEINPTLEIT